VRYFSARHCTNFIFMKADIINAELDPIYLF